MGIGQRSKTPAWTKAPASGRVYVWRLIGMATRMRAELATRMRAEMATRMRAELATRMRAEIVQYNRFIHISSRLFYIYLNISLAISRYTTYHGVTDPRFTALAPVLAPESIERMHHVQRQTIQ